MSHILTHRREQTFIVKVKPILKWKQLLQQCVKNIRPLALCVISTPSGLIVLKCRFGVRLFLSLSQKSVRVRIYKSQFPERITCACKITQHKAGRFRQRLFVSKVRKSLLRWKWVFSQRLPNSHWVGLASRRLILPPHAMYASRSLSLSWAAFRTAFFAWPRAAFWKLSVSYDERERDELLGSKVSGSGGRSRMLFVW